jgi:hypothetical protein
LKENGGYYIYQDHIMNFTEQEFYKTQATSLSNLQRLGLIEIDYSSYTSNDNDYNYANYHPAFIIAKADLIEVQKTNPGYINVDFKKGLSSKTPLCDDFISICL